MAIARGYRASPAEKDEATARRRRPEADHGHQTQLQRHCGPLGLGARRQASPFYQLASLLLALKLAASATHGQRDSLNAGSVCGRFFLPFQGGQTSGVDERGVAPRMQKRSEPDGPEPLVCGKIGKIAALLPHTQLPPVALADWSTKHDQRENESTGLDKCAPALPRRLGLGLGPGVDSPAAVSPAPAAEVRKRPLSSLDTSTENVLVGSTENMLPERKRRYQGGQRPSPHPSAWW